MRFGLNPSLWEDRVIMRFIPVLCAAGVLAAGPPAGQQPTVRLTDNYVQMLSPWDVANPAVGYLNPGLLTAVQRAATAAAADGVTIMITSGWRSPEFQQQLLNDAVATYGSLGAARQYVQAPEHSKHVLGQAVDIGGVDADYWLIANGGRFGLCQIYANERWHFELAADAVGGCPPLRANAAG